MALYTTYFDFQPGRQGGSRRTDRTAQVKKLVGMFIALVQTQHEAWAAAQ